MKKEYFSIVFVIIFLINCTNKNEVIENNTDSNNKISLTNMSNIKIFEGENWKILTNPPIDWIFELNDLNNHQIVKFYEENKPFENNPYMDIVVLENYVLLSPDDNDKELNEYYFIRFINRHIKNSVDKGIQVILQDKINLNIENNYYIITQDYSSNSKEMHYPFLLSAFIEYWNQVFIITLHAQNSEQAQELLIKFIELINNITFL